MITHDNAFIKETLDEATEALNKGSDPVQVLGMVQTALLVEILNSLGIIINELRKNE